jgi:hypothetical protein
MTVQTRSIDTLQCSVLKGQALDILDIARSAYGDKARLASNHRRIEFVANRAVHCGKCDSITKKAIKNQFFVIKNIDFFFN